MSLVFVVLEKSNWFLIQSTFIMVLEEGVSQRLLFN